jgi:DNA-3-methyladenine glycosylase
MWGRPGTAYVYLVYGMYDCLNVVTEPEGRPSALLIRAVEPLAGIDAMRRARIDAVRRRRRVMAETTAARIDALPPHRLAQGPGLVAAAFGLDRSHTGVDLLEAGSAVRLESADADDPPPDPAWTARIGVDYAGEGWADRPWRLVDRSSRSLSGPRLRRIDG